MLSPIVESAFTIYFINISNLFVRQTCKDSVESTYPGRRSKLSTNWNLISVPTVATFGVLNFKDM